MAHEHAVEIREVVKSYGEVPALRGISLAVEPGEMLTLLGPSGCGKTTLLYLIAGFIPPDAGDVLISGERVTGLPPFRRNIGVVFQNYALFPHMSVFENVAFGLRMRKVPAAEMSERVNDSLETVKLTGFANRLPRALSGGQQQRVALARALVVNPRVLLLDEPLSALDKHLRSSMQVELREIQQKVGVTTIFVTHDQSEALILSDRIAVMELGTVQQLSAPIDLYRRPQSRFVASFIGDVNSFSGRIVSRDAGTVTVQLAGGVTLRVPVQGDAATRNGEEVTVFVRPEKLAPGPDGAHGDLSARVVDHVYQGSFVDTHCEAPGVGRFYIRSLGDAVISRYPVDSPISVTLDPADVVVLPAASAPGA